MTLKFKEIFKSDYAILFLLALANLLVAFYFVRYPLQLNGDAPSYLNAMRLISGQPYDQSFGGADTEVILKARLLTTPLMMYSSVIAGKIFGGEYGGMLAVNTIFYFLIILVFYRLVLEIYQNKKVAFLSSILFFGNYCLTNYGVTFRTDLGGWLFFLLASLMAINYFKHPEQRKFFYLSILSSAIGVLFKEYGALGMLTLGVLVLFRPTNILQKAKEIGLAAVLFLVIPLAYYALFFWQWHFSYFDWYHYATINVINNPSVPGIDWSILLLAKVLGWLFLAGWPIFLWGLFQEYKNFDSTRLKMIIALLPASFSFLAWPGLTQRIAFVLVPLLAMISGYGLSKLKNKYFVAAVVLLYVLINYWIRNLSVVDLMHLINF